MSRLTEWLQSKFGGQPPPDKPVGELTDEETVNVVKKRLEQQARRIALLDAQVDAQRGAPK
jgi:hypothetical protein